MLPGIKKIRLRWWVLLGVAGLVVVQVARWGRPVPRVFSVEGYDANAREWRIVRHSSPAETWRARDAQGNGVMDEFETPAGRFVRPGNGTQPRRWLVVCLDGVPATTMQHLWDTGHFREFYRPSTVVSVLPSDSEAALTAVLHAAPPPGYEHRYFDRERNELRGGAWITLTGEHIPYIRVLDYDPPGWAKALPYIEPLGTYRADLGRFRKRFLASDRKAFLAHIAASDSLFHMLVESRMEPLLAEFEGVLSDLYLDSRGELGVLVYSDHGNTLTPSHGAPLEAYLRQRGWRLGGSVQGPRDVAVPAYGLIGFIAIYCRDDTTPALAGDLTQLEGADLVIFRGRAQNSATILSAERGKAEVRWSADGSRYRYQAESGDPLELARTFEALRTAGRLAADGSASDADLFAATDLAPYPDAAARIRDWATDHVRNPANILVSLKPGYFYGSGIFQHIVKFTGTHGALDAGSSLGFAMSTQPLPAVQRLADVIPKEMLRERPDRAP